MVTPTRNAVPTKQESARAPEPSKRVRERPRTNIIRGLSFFNKNLVNLASIYHAKKWRDGQSRALQQCLNPINITMCSSSKRGMHDLKCTN